MPRLRDHEASYHTVPPGVRRNGGKVYWLRQTGDTLSDARTQLRKGLLAVILPEVTFYCNHLDNASIKISPHMLAFGRQPSSPIDMLITTGNTTITESGMSASQYFQTVTKMKEELLELARENHDSSRSGAKIRYDKGKKQSDIAMGDWVMIRKEQRTDSLDIKFEGPFQVLERRGVIVQVSLTRGNKWVHLNRCKRYEMGLPLIIHPESLEEQYFDEVEMRQEPETGNIEIEDIREDGLNGSAEGGREEAGEMSGEEPRRYPKRDRKQKVYKDFVNGIGGLLIGGGNSGRKPSLIGRRGDVIYT